MEQTNFKKTVQTQDKGNTHVIREQVETSADPAEFTLAKLSQIIWFFGHFLAAVLGLRFVFLLLGARLTGIVLLIYNITAVLILPFKGIFPSAQSGISYFDSAALLGIVMYYLIIALITKIISLFSKNTDE